MNIRYRILYRLGITPWDREQVPGQVRRLAAEWPQPGRALDVGCGTGRDAVHLAQHGWMVTAIDSVPQALDAARARARNTGVEVSWVQGDVTELQRARVGEGFDLVLDRGCFHGLSDEDRERCAHGITDAAAPGAQLLMFGFVPRWRGGIAPRGISAEQLIACFGEQWELLSSDADSDVQLPRWLHAEPTWHRLKKRLSRWQSRPLRPIDFAACTKRRPPGTTGRFASSTGPCSPADASGSARRPKATCWRSPSAPAATFATTPTP